MRPAEGPRESAASSASSHPGERGSDPSDAPCVRAFASTRLRLRADSSTTSACTATPAPMTPSMDRIWCPAALCRRAPPFLCLAECPPSPAEPGSGTNDSAATITAYEIEIAIGTTVMRTAVGSPPGMRKGRARSDSGCFILSATKDHMKRRMEGTESSIENSTSRVYGAQTRDAATAALKRMYTGATPVSLAASSHTSSASALPPLRRRLSTTAFISPVKWDATRKASDRSAVRAAALYKPIRHTFAPSWNP
mmetsp:Transcript_3478/g.10189  ORF Transcript_3478/g.10189 Transcript_3478/m.10189 type:complete len:253 (+) Transcript_3478:2002-2760(+)